MLDYATLRQFFANASTVAIAALLLMAGNPAMAQGVADPLRSILTLGGNANVNQQALGLRVADICEDFVANNPASGSAAADLFNRCGGLVGLAAGTSSDQTNALNALNQITGEEIIAYNSALTETNSMQVGNIGARLSQLSGRPNRLGIASLFTRQPGQRGLAALGTQGQPGVASGQSDSGRGSGFGAFVNGQFGFGDKDATIVAGGLEAGYDFDAFGITAGIDYIFSDSLVLGGAFGYGSSEADFDNEGGETEASSVSASLYGLFQLSEIVSSTILVSYSWQDYSSMRNLEYTDAVGPVSRSIEGDTDGNSFALSAGLAADFVRGSTTFTPTARVDYLDAKIDGFEENTTGGPDGLALVYLDQDIKSFRTALGMQASITINTSSGIIVPHVRAEFIHEFEDNARAILARYLHDPNPTEQPVGNSTGATFTITTDVPDRDWFTIGGGLSAVFAGGMSIFIDYETVIGFADVSDHSITAGARIEF